MTERDKLSVDADCVTCGPKVSVVNGVRQVEAPEDWLVDKLGTPAEQLAEAMAAAEMLGVFNDAPAESARTRVDDTPRYASPRTARAATPQTTPRAFGPVDQRSTPPLDMHTAPRRRPLAPGRNFTLAETDAAEVLGLTPSFASNNFTFNQTDAAEVLPGRLQFQEVDKLSDLQTDRLRQFDDELDRLDDLATDPETGYALLEDAGRPCPSSYRFSRVVTSYHRYMLASGHFESKGVSDLLEAYLEDYGVAGLNVPGEALRKTLASMIDGIVLTAERAVPREYTPELEAALKSAIAGRGCAPPCALPLITIEVARMTRSTIGRIEWKTGASQVTLSQIVIDPKTGARLEVEIPTVHVEIWVPFELTWTVRGRLECR